MTTRKKNPSSWLRREQEMTIADLLREADRSAVTLAVVDYGPEWLRNGSNGRFGARDLRHVEIYGLKVVAYNRAARRAGHQVD